MPGSHGAGATHIYGLKTDGTTGANAGRVISSDGDEYIDGVGVGDEVYDIERVLDEAVGYPRITVVATVHIIGDTLNKGHWAVPKSFAAYRHSAWACNTRMYFVGARSLHDSSPYR